MRATSIESTRRRARGVTLIEVLVGITIGMIGMIVIFQVVTVWDARTRASSSGTDAQVTGSLAMYNLERDRRRGGLGFGGAETSAMGCPLSGYDSVASASLGPFPLVPIEIVDGDDEPDRINVLYGNSPYLVVGERISGGTPHTVGTRSSVGFKAGDVAVVTDAAAPRCRLVQVVENAASGADKTISFDRRTYTDFYKNATATSRFNDSTGLSPPVTTGKVYSLGPTPHRNSWQIADHRTLGYSDELQARPFFSVADGVIDLQAEYGYDADNDTRIAAGEWTSTLPAPPDWTRVRAIRVAILVRSRNFEKPVGASAVGESAYFAASAPAWARGAFQMRNVDGTADSNPPASPNNWRYYRYRVYEKVIPLRNVIWGRG
jgi:type IV pilus assembly protein PilW